MAGTPAQVVLPAGGLVDGNGTAASGAVTVEVTPINPATEPESMPGNFTAAGNGTPVQIESFGALNVNLRDASGRALNIASGRSATVRIPLASRAASAPATIKLYWFNEQTGLWVEEGTATLAGTAPNQYYEGTISHFSTWNADIPYQTIEIGGCVEDANTTRVPGVTVQSAGVDYSGTSRAVTDATGRFQLAIKRGGRVTIFGETVDRATNVRTEGPFQANAQLTPCLLLGATGQPPQIVEQPKDQSILLGGFALFESQAIGSAPLRYQWQRNGVDIAGAVSSVYLVASAQASDNAARFSVVVTNAYGNATSSQAMLSVDTTPLPPQIQAPPQPVAVTAGATASFSVVALSRGGILSYQWRRNGMPINGATTDNYATPATTLADNGALFSVTVSSTNTASVTSGTALLTVVAAPVAPQVTQQPTDARVNVGQSASFSVTATGSAPLAYQWRKNGVAIVGATAASYTTPATALVDSGALFTVVISNAGGNATSNAATLTVDNVVSTIGYHFLALAGTEVGGTMTYANGSQGFQAAALLAVNSTNPAAGAVTVAPAGTAQLSRDFVQGTFTGNLIETFRIKYTVYVKDGRFYRFDHDVPATGTPAGTLLSTLTTAEVCASNGVPSTKNSFDVTTVQNSWFFVRAPGPDNVCFTSDDVTRAIRLDMGANAVPGTVAGSYHDTIRDATLAMTGLIFVEVGSQVVLRDANLTNPRTLFTTGGFIRSKGSDLTATPPGVWVFIDGSTLYGVNLASPSVRTPLATLQAGDDIDLEIASDGSTIFVMINNPTNAAVAKARVIKVTVGTTLSATPVAQFNAVVRSFGLTPTRIVVATAGGVVSVPKAGGAQTPLITLGGTDQATFLVTSGENVYLSVTNVNVVTGASTARVEIVASDGGNPQTLVNTAAVTFGYRNSTPFYFDFARVDVLYLASPVPSAASMAGAALRSIDGVTRATLTTYGSLPATPAGIIFPPQFDFGFYGDPLLLSYFRTDGVGGISSDLYWIDTNSTGLVRVTNYVVGAAPIEPFRATGMRPLKADRSSRGW